MTRADVVVVGAGASGLAAAYRLRKAGLSVLVLEARGRVGGRTWSETVSGAVIDHGGQWIGPPQTRVCELVEELGIETFSTYGGGESRRFLKGGVTGVTLSLLREAFADINEMAAQLPVGAPWEAPLAREWDGQTMRTWLIDRLADPIAFQLGLIVISAIFTAEADEISLLHVLAYVRSAGSMENLTEVVGGAQERRFVKGAQHLSNRLAEEIGLDRIMLNAPVQRLEQGEGGVRAKAEGFEVDARRAIVAVPTCLTERIAFHPKLPARRSQLHQRMAPGTTIKFHAIYESPFWREQGSNGRVMSDLDAVSVTFDNSPPSGNPGVLVAFAEADQARRVGRMSLAERREVVISNLVQFFGPEAGNPVSFVEANWSEEEWTRGCYGGNFSPGGWTRFGLALREPFELIHWAGTETSEVWMNYIEGAVTAGERAASEIIRAFG